MARGRRWWWWLGTALAIGCADDDDPCDFRICDIETHDCVEEVAATMACRRDVEPLLPEVRFLTRAEVLVEWIADELTPEQLQLQREYNTAEALVGLMPEGYEPTDATADQLENVAAFYSRDSGGVTIITDSGIDDPAFAYEILAHEMVHVYQDAAWDLNALTDSYATTWDRFLGLRAVVEGDAEVYQSLAALALLRISPDEADWDAFFRDFQQAMLDRAAQTETPSLDVLGLFPYAFGVAYVHPAWDDDGIAGVERVVLDPPDSTRQVIRGSPGKTRTPINEDALLDPSAVPLLPEHTFLGGSHQGIWLVNAMLQRTAGSQSPFALPPLDEVGADFFSAFRHDATGEIVAVWRMRGAATLTALLEQSASRWRSTDDGDMRHAWRIVDGDVVLLAVTPGSPTTADAVFDTIEGWQTPQAAEEAAGIDGGPRRSPIADVPWACNLHASH